MTKRKREKSNDRSADRASAHSKTAIALWIAVFAIGGVAALLVVQRKPPFERVAGAVANPTFHRDVAPIVHQHCSPCHRAGQAAPFDLLTLADVRKRARDILDVVERRVMPPWLPDAADGPFVGQRSLTAQQIATLARWIEGGMPEGSVADAKPLPRWNDEWQLGAPDLVIRMPEPYVVAADGPDIYRNFVIPIPNVARRFVKGIELRPGNPRVVHHAFMRIDATGESRRRDEAEAGVGFGGLHTPVTAQTPQGQFLSWQPGKLHTFAPRGLAWTLEMNCDLILQVHLRPSGKRELLQSSIGFHFTDEPPTNTPFKIGLRSFDIDIPAGASNHVVRDSYTLAADVEVLSILPHAHYLGRGLRAFATLPDGREQRLLHIPDWDFDWQGDYLYRKPVVLPRGTTVAMEWHYDNSTNNVRNPNAPPRRVRYGLQSSDEMAELWLQVLPLRTNDLSALARYDQPRVFRDALAYNRHLLALNPNDSRAHCESGKAQLFLGNYAEAETALRRAAALDTGFDEPRYFLGLLARMQNRLPQAAGEFTAAIRLNPSHAKAHGNLGLVLLAQGEFQRAESHLREALRLNPQDEIAKQALADLAKLRGGSADR